MLDVNKTRLLVQHESNDCKCGLNESVCNSKENGFMMNISMSVKIQMIGVFVKMIYGILVHATASVIKPVKLANIQILKIGHATNVSFVNYNLTCEDEKTKI